MALLFNPAPGTILVCDYSTGFVVPEMIKVRPVIVVSPNFKSRAGLCTVVPLSTTAPSPIMGYHCEMTFNPRLPAPFDAPTMWAKADMLATVSYQRLDRIRAGRDALGRRLFIAPSVSAQDLQALRKAVLNALGFGHLTPHI